MHQHPISKRALLVVAILPLLAMVAAAEETQPNILLIMADDLGWGDPHYNGYSEIVTVNLDRMAADGMRFNRFYSAAPVCSPTRASCLTGRHPFRFGVFGANRGHLKAEESTLAEVLRDEHYATGHFGKWHLGTLTKDVKDGRRGGREGQVPHYSPPWENGFDECFSAEVQMPTWNPMENQAFESKYWIGPGSFATENLAGDDSRVIADRAVDFISRSAERRQPFFAVVWFHTPHSPVIAGDSFRDKYSQLDENRQHYYGAVTAMDEQIGRLRETLTQHGIADNTIVWFCSDNGPARQGRPRHVGSPGPFRGFKTSLYEGGIRVPGLIVWPGKVKPGMETDVVCSTHDYFLTTLSAVGAKSSVADRPMDGIDLTPVLTGQLTQRPEPLGFQHGKQFALIGHRHKILSRDRGDTWQLFDLIADPSEEKDLIEEHPELAQSMIATFHKWQHSCELSNRGADYR